MLGKRLDFRVIRGEVECWSFGYAWLVRLYDWLNSGYARLAGLYDRFDCGYGYARFHWDMIALTVGMIGVIVI